jgi:tRNA-dihydrouridine synthase 1
MDHQLEELESQADPYKFYTSVGCPKYFVAPMVDQSELPYRMLTRKYKADICYTPMFHARLFGTDARYRKDMFKPCKEDRPLVVQFCANDPDVLLKAAKFVENDCDAVDINLGCP